MNNETDVAVGVIGVGSMGQHHARVYQSLPGVELKGVYDADTDRAMEVAGRHGTRPRTLDELLGLVDAVSIAVPTRFHYETAERCLDAGCDVLVEKPFVRDTSQGRDLLRKANRHDAIIQVGHVERFNPAVLALPDILDGREIVAFNAKRLGPPLDRTVEDSAVLDLMIHDIDIVLSIMDEAPATISSAGVRKNTHATAALTFPSDVVAELTASRLTQKKVRKLDIIAEECLISVDYIDRSIEIHRASTPEFIQDNDTVRYRHESIIERPMVDSTEPLRNELSSFVESVRDRSEPVVSGKDGLDAVEIAQHIEQTASEKSVEPAIPIAMEGD